MNIIKEKINKVRGKKNVTCVTCNDYKLSTKFFSTVSFHVHTLTRGYGRIPGMVAERRAAAGRCGVAYETVSAVASPPHHAVDVPAALRGDGAVEGGVGGGAVQSWSGKKHIWETRI